MERSDQHQSSPTPRPATSRMFVDRAPVRDFPLGGWAGCRSLAAEVGRAIQRAPKPVPSCLVAMSPNTEDIEVIQGVRTFEVAAIFDPKQAPEASRINPHDRFDLAVLVERRSDSPTDPVSTGRYHNRGL